MSKVMPAEYFLCFDFCSFQFIGSIFFCWISLWKILDLDEYEVRELNSPAFNENPQVYSIVINVRLDCEICYKKIRKAICSLCVCGEIPFSYVPLSLTGNCSWYYRLSVVRLYVRWKFDLCVYQNLHLSPTLLAYFFLWHILYSADNVW